MKDIPFVDIQQNGRSLNFFSLPSSVPILAHYLQDFGLVARLGQGDMDAIVSAGIHCANRDYASLVDDFILLGILPNDCDRVKVIPLMDKALTPYVMGGGAKRYEAELKKMYGFDET